MSISSTVSRKSMNAPTRGGMRPRSSRVAFDAKVHLFFDFNPWKIHFPARLVNLSKSGALIQTSGHSPRLEALLEAEQGCKIQIDPSDSTLDSFFTRARFARSHKHGDVWFVGLSFEDSIENSVLDSWASLITNSDEGRVH